MFLWALQILYYNRLLHYFDYLIIRTKIFCSQNLVQKDCDYWIKYQNEGKTFH